MKSSFLCKNFTSGSEIPFGGDVLRQTEEIQNVSDVRQVVVVRQLMNLHNALKDKEVITEKWSEDEILKCSYVAILKKLFWLLRIKKYLQHGYMREIYLGWILPLYFSKGGHRYENI